LNLKQKYGLIFSLCDEGWWNLLKIYPQDQNKTPLLSALLSYMQDETIPFHVPGHKQGRGNRELTELLGENCMQIDLTCFDGLDNICNPVSVIKEAESLAAQLYGADNAFFLVNGTTSGIQAMIMSVCNPGDKILIPRNAHKSAIGGIIVSGAIPVYLEPEIDEYMGVAMGITPEAVINALENNSDIKALFIINPTYYGIASNLKAIVDIAHTYKIPVIVDEAHGAHLKFNKNLPLSAMEAGADMAASSTHKLGGSLTQSSLLLHQGNLISREKIKAVLNLAQTTSPSYILLASLDVARKQLATNGQEMISEAYRLALWAREEIQKIDGLYLLGEDVIGQPGCFDFDPTKIVINVRELGISGYEIERILRKEFKIQVELSDLFNIILLVSLGDSESTLNPLIKALKDISGRYSLRNVIKYFIPLPNIPESVVSPREAFYDETKNIQLADAEGEISAEMIMAYPPGIPIVCPGERLTREIIDYVNILKNENAILQGTEDPAVEKIKVLTRRLVLVQNGEKGNQQAI